MSLRNFELDLARAITEQLVEHFDEMPASSLTREAVVPAHDDPGVYQLFLHEKLMYVGKSDSSLKNRLERHLRSLTGRRNIDLDSMAFKGIHISRNWSALTTEAALIAHFGRTPWNFSGFGSNDPGRNRDDTAVPADSFDAMYPIDPEFAVALDAGTRPAEEVLTQLKSRLPYLLRYGSSAAERDELRQTQITITQPQTTAHSALTLVARTLPAGWQATVLPGRMLLYRERRAYATGEVIWPL